MAAIYSNGGNRWNILDFNFTKRDALSSIYKISMHKSDVWLQGANIEMGGGREGGNITKWYITTECM